MADRIGPQNYYARNWERKMQVEAELRAMGRQDPVEDPNAPRASEEEALSARAETYRQLTGQVFPQGSASARQGLMPEYQHTDSRFSTSSVPSAPSPYSVTSVQEPLPAYQHADSGATSPYSVTSVQELVPAYQHADSRFSTPSAPSSREPQPHASGERESQLPPSFLWFDSMSASSGPRNPSYHPSSHSSEAARQEQRAMTYAHLTGEPTENYFNRLGPSAGPPSRLGQQYAPMYHTPTGAPLSADAFQNPRPAPAPAPAENPSYDDSQSSGRFRRLRERVRFGRR